MARRIYLWLPGLTLAALSACGGSETDFFGNGGGGGSSRAGAASHAGSSSNSSAGNANSAGKPGSAGALGVAGNGAGNVGSGGDGEGEAGRSSAGAASGGTSASGGRAGASNTGGAGGTGGRTGSGGTGATAGRGGSPGAGGSGENPSCDDLRKLAEQQLEDARACNVAASSLQCTGEVDNTCGCPVPVRRDDSAETKAYLATMKKIDAKDCSWPCTKQACQIVTDAECRASGSSTMGTCVAVSNGPGHGS